MLFKIVAISCLVACVSCATQVRRSPLTSAAGQTEPQASLAGGSQDKAAQQAKLHYVEIGPSLKGDYKFGYDTGSGPAGQSFREETRLDDGTVKGAYGYVDANGKQRIVKYTAGKAGFVVESDAEAGQQGAAAAATAPRQEPRPEPAQAAQPLVPASLPQQQQPGFDDQAAPVQINRQTAAHQVNTEQQHAQQLRQHQLAHQRALAEQQQLAQQQQLQQQQILQQQQQAQLAAQQQRAQVPQQQSQPQPPAQAQPHFPAAPQHHHHHHQQQQQQQQQHFPTAQSAAHQFADPQTGHFFSSSNDQNINQLLLNQLRQLQAPQAAPAPSQQQFEQGPQQFGAQPQPAFRQPSFGPIQPSQQVSNLPPQQPQPIDFSHQLRARQVAAQQFNQAPPQQQAALASPQSALLALHQQQQHDAQLLAQLRAQQLAQAPQQSRFGQQPPPQQQVAVPQASPIEARAASQQQQQFLPQPQFAPQAQAQAQPQAQHHQAQPQQPANVAQAQPVEAFGPPVIDIRTLNYSIGQQTRVN